MKQFIIVHKLQVQNANAISSPFTYGFPAVTAFLGFAHSLQRRFNALNASELSIDGVGVVCHRFQMQDHRDGYDRTLCLTANPLNEKGERAPFVEEGRCRMTISLVLETGGLTQVLRDAPTLQEIICSQMKLAGGDVLSVQGLVPVVDDRKAVRKLMPGYVLVERRSLMMESMAQGLDAFEAIHQHVALQHRCKVDDAGNVSWVTKRHAAGWIVPIATGFQALTPPALPKNARDMETPHRFAEAIVTLGEFVLASRMESLNDTLWRYRHRDDLYWCQQERALQET